MPFLLYAHFSETRGVKQGLRVLNSDLIKIRRGPDLPERDYCVRRGVSVFKTDI